MFSAFFRYFFNYLIKAKTRQHLLFLAIIGLCTSSFALLVLQSTMGGLQKKLKGRSKNVKGEYIVYIKDYEQTQWQSVSEYLDSEGIKYSREYQIEILARYEDKLSPLVVHGIDFDSYLPNFLRAQQASRDLIVPTDLARRMRWDYGDSVQLISPAHTTTMFGEIPRYISAEVTDFILTEVPEIDMAHVWISMKAIQNLVRERKYNRLIIHDEMTDAQVKGLNSLIEDSGHINSWEKENSSLVWALRLETLMIIFLFAGMSLLVSLCIVSGIFIFLNKIKIDLSTFWILGASVDRLKQHVLTFMICTSQISIVIGLILAIVFLFLFDQYVGDIMPHIFVDRKIPVDITFKGLLVSYLIPSVISTFFTWLAFNHFGKRSNFTDSIRTY